MSDDERRDHLTPFGNTLLEWLTQANLNKVLPVFVQFRGRWQIDICFAAEHLDRLDDLIEDVLTDVASIHHGTLLDLSWDHYVTLTWGDVSQARRPRPYPEGLELIEV